MERARGALQRYRVMAWVTGTMLLLLTTEVVLKYGFHAGGVDADGAPLPVIGVWVAMTHGFVYVVYLVTVVDLWGKMRWGLGRLVTMAAAGARQGVGHAGSPVRTASASRCTRRSITNDITGTTPAPSWSSTSAPSTPS